MFIFLFLEWKFCITMESLPNEPIPLTATAYPSFCNMWTKTITAASVWYFFFYFDIIWNLIIFSEMLAVKIYLVVHT